MSDCDATYDEVTSPMAKEKFAMEDNQCYGSLKVAPQEDKVTSYKNRNIIPSLVVTVVLVIVLILAVAACCIAFAVEIAKLKSAMISSGEEELSVSIPQSRLNSLEEFMNSSMALNLVTQQLISSINDSLLSLIEQLRIELTGSESFPVASCASLPSSSPSGYYGIRASNGSAVRVYCDMTVSCGNITGGWMRVAELDMTNSCHQCPSGLMQGNDSTIRTCVSSNRLAGCSPDIVYTVNNINYTHVCGRIIGYQIGSTNAFGSQNTANPTNIDQHYVDGVSLTHGRNPREHIWTFAAARDTSAEDRCPCINSNAFQPPSFVGTDYFCDTGSESTDVPDMRFFGDDPLWDGDGCTQPNTCCRFNTPPWFYRELPQPITDDIEMRVCKNEGAQHEDVAIEIIELYVH